MKNAIVCVLAAAVIAMEVGIPSAYSASAGNSILKPVIQSDVFFEDFDNPSNWNGANPPSGWGITDNGAADGIWDSYDWARYTAWGGGTARVNGGSNNRYNNDWIISPSINFITASACTLFFRHYYDDYVTQAADSALVMLSIDGGVNWGDTVEVYAGSDFGSDTVPDSEYFDISDFAAGHSSVKVAFQYVKRQPVLVGSWRIDDIKFKADGSTLMSQNFDLSWGPFGDNPPIDWIINDINVVRWDDNDWHQANITNWGNIAEVNWSPVEQQNEFLKSQIMDFSDTTYDIILSLKQWYDDQPDNRDTAFILGSIDGGVTWPETLAVYQGIDHGSLNSPAYNSFPMLSWANYQSNVRLGFKYVGNNDSKWYIDSVRVERIDMLASDVAVTAIINPPSATITGYTWPVTAHVENVGLNSSSFDVIYLISDSLEARVYSDTQIVTNLPSQGERTVTFDNWVPAEPNTHYLKCYTRLISDMDRSNDSLSVETYTYVHIGNAGPVDGWFYDDNMTGGGSPYVWVDIKSVGSPINFGDDDDGNSGMIDMGIDFDYFGQTYSRIAISTDGWLSFEDSIDVDNSKSPIPDSDGPPAMIALLWNDLHLRTGHIYSYNDVANNSFIVQFDSVEFKSTAGSDIGMEIIFNATDNTIKMQYSYFAGGMPSDVTIGLENQAQDAGLPFNNNGQVGQTPCPGLAITYTFLPPHDVKTVAIDQPTLFLYGDNTYDIIARFRNVGANIESFNVTAYDNFGYINTQTVTNLASLATIAVTFSAWTISHQCSTYQLNVFTDLPGDLHAYNDSLRIDLESTTPVVSSIVYDDGIPFASLTSSDPHDIVANRFEVLYDGGMISAVAFKCLNQDEQPSNPGPDSMVASLFLDGNNDGIPEVNPVFSRKIPIPLTGWTLWKVGCDTTITLSCHKKFWAGWSISNLSDPELIFVDRRLDHPQEKWVRSGGVWQIFDDPAFFGDNLIRAFIKGNSNTAPNLLLGDSQLSGAASPNGADTVSTYIQNTGTGCSLNYSVSVVQSDLLQNTLPDFRIPVDNETPPVSFETRNIGNRQTEKSVAMATPLNPPQILGSGGPDNYGYTWFDSDDVNGPLFAWMDISSLGTQVNWDNGNADDGYTDPIPMDMTFNFYGANYESIVISTNGWVSFEPATNSFTENLQIPFADELDALLAVDWDDLDGGTPGRCYYYHDAAANTFIISWINWSHYPSPTSSHDFQIILDGTSGTILYQYGTGAFQSDITIGIESGDGTDGLQVAFNQSYLHNSLAVLFSPPIFWLSTDLPNGSLPPQSSQMPFNIFMNARGLPAGIYNGSVVIHSDDVDQPVATIHVQFQIEGVCAYLPGDVNGSGSANGIDVTFMVVFFRGGNPPHDDCPPCEALGSNMLYPQGDVNASCAWNGIDVTYFVNYLKGIGPNLRFCDDCPPAGRVAKIINRQITPILAPSGTTGAGPEVDR